MTELNAVTAAENVQNTKPVQSAQKPCANYNCTGFIVVCTLRGCIPLNATACTLKAIKNAIGTSVIFPINISLMHFVFVLTSVPNVGERFTKT